MGKKCAVEMKNLQEKKDCGKKGIYNAGKT
jgi:hypothetical protein